MAEGARMLAAQRQFRGREPAAAGGPQVGELHGEIERQRERAPDPQRTLRVCGD
jgi:hypothetical protein